MSSSRRSKFFGSAAIAVILAAPVFVAPTSPGWAQDSIVVTARRREESLLEIPISVSVKTQQQIDDMGIGDIDDLSEFTPGLVIEDSMGAGGGRGEANLAFRGIREQISTAGSKTGAVFWDGAYISDGFGLMPLIDLERAEILKGPQNAYFARNTFAGAANFVPKSPGDEWEGKGNVDVGFGLRDDEQNSYSGTIAIGGPISDEVGLRVAGRWGQEGADYEYANGDPNGEYENKAVYGVATWDPTDDLSLKFTGLFIDADDTRSSSSIIAQGAVGSCSKTFTGKGFNPVTNVKTAFTTDLSKSKIKLFCGVLPEVTAANVGLGPTGQLDAVLASAFGPGSGAGILAAALAPNALIADHDFETLEQMGAEYRVWRSQMSGTWDMGGGYTASWLGSYGASKNSAVIDFWFGSGPAGNSSLMFPVGRFHYIRDAFVEARVETPQDGRIRAMAGVSYYDQVQDNMTTGGPSMDIQENEAFGIFGSLEYDVIADGSLTLGFDWRWTDDEQTLVLVGAPTSATVIAGEDNQVNEVNQYNDFMPRAYVNYKLTDNTNVYFSWSQGTINSVSTRCLPFNAQTGLSMDCATAGQFTGIQENMSYEIGIKTGIDWLQYSLAAYYQEWENQPFNNVVLLASGTTPVFTVPGDSEYWGAEFEFAANLGVLSDAFEGVAVDGGVGWVDAELTRLGETGSQGTTVLCPSAQAGRNIYSNFTSAARCTALDGGGVIDSAGKRPRYIPEWTANFGLTITRQLFNTGRDFYLRADAIYEGGRYVDNSEYLLSEGYWTANVRIGGYINDGVKAELYVNNISDDMHAPMGSTTGTAGGRKGFIILPDKRELGIRFFADF